MTHGKVDAAIMTDPALEIVRQQLPQCEHPRRHADGEGDRATFMASMTYPSVVLYSTTPGSPESRSGIEAPGSRHSQTTLDWMRSHTPQEIRDKMRRAVPYRGCRYRYRRAAALMQAMLSPDGRLHAESVAAVRKGFECFARRSPRREHRSGKTYTNEFTAPVVIK